MRHPWVDPWPCLVSQPGVLCEGNARAITLSVGGQFVVVLGKNHRSPTSAVGVVLLVRRFANLILY